ncbi:TPA: hypothetical protein NH710_004352 [Pseudomonas aeruginosa]|nr:hypothetical protein [Pseudomonas aeruginosa]
MPKYSALNLIKRKAKAFADANGIPLSSAHNQLAQQFKFNNFHELTVVAGQSTLDPRIALAAFGTTELDQAIWEDDLPDALDMLLEEALSSAIADTNAYDFSFEDLDIEQATYDEANGTLTLIGSLTYSGTPDEDRMYHGSKFYLDVQLTLLRRDEKWIFHDEIGLAILAGESDVDRDHQAEEEDLYQSYLKDQ